MPSSKTLGRRNLSVEELKDSLKGVVDLDLKGWEILGDVMVIELPGSYSRSEKRVIGEQIIRLHPKAKTVVNRISIDNELRRPDTEVIAGDETLTVYKEHGSLFKLDPRKVMFSFGNKDERWRMAKISSPSETVVDMFACVGQFSIPLARHSRPKEVIAIEKNPIAHGFLQENIILNKLENTKALLGDCRALAPQGVADRVVMGYIFETIRFLPTALKTLKDRGVIHYHFLSDLSRLDKNKEQVLMTIAKKGFEGTIANTVKVKSYAPQMYHWVLDIEITK